MTRARKLFQALALAATLVRPVATGIADPLTVGSFVGGRFVAEGAPVADRFGALQEALADRYAVERELGQGGSATVYLALDLKFRRPVALKVLAPELALAVRTERFRREIDIAARLNHPHILPLFEADSAGSFLYYTMPPVEGESLRERVAREGPLAIEEAVRIARQVADALEYAHRHDVIHRDIKPGNILLTTGHAWVADFGIARAIAGADALVTNTGVPLGTPAYMSPEQISSAAELDPRTDIYSLGCVVYEMLAGEPPFAGPTVQSVLAQHLADPVPALRAARPDVPEGLAQIVQRALAKDPSKRFRTAAGFSQALAVGRPGPDRAPIRRFVRAAVGVSLVVAVAWAGRQDWFGLQLSASSSRTRLDLDTLRYLILPFEYEGGLVVSINEDQLLHDALTRWTGITVVDRLQVRETVAERGSGPLDGRESRQVAVGLGAGRYIRGEVSRIADSMRVHATLYDATVTGHHVREGTIKLRGDLANADSAFGVLADRLLFEEEQRLIRLGGDARTRSFPARQAYARGIAAVERWDLPAADSAFVASAEYDPGFSQAHLWVAQARFWGGATPATWRSSAERAAAGRRSLSARERLLSDALIAFAQGELERACAACRRLTVLGPYDFAAWYGLATCLSRDDAVLRDRSSPSGWRFRTSYHETTRAYQHAFQLLPSIHQSLRRGSYEFVRRLLLTSGNMVRFGHGLPPNPRRFAAYPSWRGDTLALIPQPVEVLGGPHEMPPTMGLAIRRERELFHEIATAWVTAFPTSAAAVEALAISLDMLGDPSAADTLRRARSLVTTPAERLRVAGAEAWMRARYSIPHDLTGVRAAKVLADSLLRAYRPPGAAEPLLVASLAALTGRAHLAAALTGHSAVVAEWSIPAPLALAGGPLLVFSALGGPVDSIRALEQQIESAIDRLVVTSQQRVRMQWLARPAQVAFPSYRFTSLPNLVGGGDYLIDAQAAYVRGDSAAVRQMFVDLKVTRRFLSPADVMPEALYPEAWLLGAIGDVPAAISWLDAALTALSATAQEKLIDPFNAGALVQAMALRAELAEQLGDREAAARWARVVAVLWGDADSFLQPRVRRMQRLAWGVP